VTALSSADAGASASRRAPPFEARGSREVLRVNRFHPGAFRRILGSALIVTAAMLPGLWPRPAAAVEPVYGSVTVIQHTPLRGDQDFHYSSEVPEMATSFDLDDDSDAYLPNEQTSGFYVPPGQYYIDQDSVNGWEVSSSCQDSNGGTNAGGSSVMVDISAGEEVICTFTNTPTTGDINIYQTTLPQDPTSFQYGGDVGTFSLADDGNEVDDGTWRNMGSQGLPAGTYVETQSFLDGWNLTDISCNDPDGGTTVDLANRKVTFDLDGGETIDCTFTNQSAAPAKGNVQFTLDTVPNNAVDVSFSGGLGSFTLDDDGNPDNGLTYWAELNSVDGGAYTENVSVPTGFVIASLACSDPDSGTTTNAGTGTFSIDLDPTESIACSVRVEPAPIHNQVNINLDTVPNDPVDVAFDFGSILKFTLDDDADGTHTNGQEYNDMDLGPWPLVAHIPTGWRLKDLACTDPDNGSTVDKANAKATVDLDAGETINCKLTIEPIPAPPPPPPAGLCNGKVATIVGKAGATTIRGTQGNDVIVDLDGNNKIDGRGGNDTICTGPGADVIDGGNGSDWIDAGDGANTITGGNDNDAIYAGSGNDTIDGGRGVDRALPGGGTNTVRNCEL
jgi:hypothetical protein